jgi:hypothetical protein
MCVHEVMNDAMGQTQLIAAVKSLLSPRNHEGIVTSPRNIDESTELQPIKDGSVPQLLHQTFFNNSVLMSNPLVLTPPTQHATLVQVNKPFDIPTGVAQVSNKRPREEAVSNKVIDQLPSNAIRSEAFTVHVSGGAYTGFNNNTADNALPAAPPTKKVRVRRNKIMPAVISPSSKPSSPQTTLVTPSVSSIVPDVGVLEPQTTVAATVDVADVVNAVDTVVASVVAPVDTHPRPTVSELRSSDVAPVAPSRPTVSELRSSDVAPVVATQSAARDSLAAASRSFATPSDVRRPVVFAATTNANPTAEALRFKRANIVTPFTNKEDVSAAIKNLYEYLKTKNFEYSSIVERELSHIVNSGVLVFRPELKTYLMLITQSLTSFQKTIYDHLMYSTLFSYITAMVHLDDLNMFNRDIFTSVMRKFTCTTQEGKTMMNNNIRLLQLLYDVNDIISLSKLLTMLNQPNFWTTPLPETIN